MATCNTKNNPNALVKTIHQNNGVRRVRTIALIFSVTDVYE